MLGASFQFLKIPGTYCFLETVTNRKAAIVQ